MMPGNKKKFSNYRLNLNGKSEESIHEKTSPRAGWRSVWTNVLTISVALIFIPGAIFFYNKIFPELKNIKSFALHNIIVEGNSRLSYDSVISIAGIKKGMSIFDISPKEIERKLKRQEWIKCVSVRKVWPDSLRIDVTERNLKAAILLKKVIYKVDDGGEIFGKFSEEEKITVPVITGVEGSIIMSGKNVLESQLLKIVQFIELYQKAGLEKFAPIGQIHRGYRGELSIYSRDGGREIAFGSGNYTRKIKNLLVLLRYLRKAKRDWEYLLIDSGEHPERIIAKLKL